MTLIKRFRHNTKGNIFSLLFAAVGLTGVLGVVGMQTVSGPVKTITKVTQKNITDTDVITNGRILILNATVRPENDSGDAGYDGDPEFEAEPHNTTCTGAPTGGGCLPTTIGTVLTDPWGTNYGYCTWNHGTVRTGAADTLDGRTDADGYVIAVISAGPNKTFDTTCAAYDDNATRSSDGGGISPEIGSAMRVGSTDDIAKAWSYAEAKANSGGLWSEVGATGASIDRDLAIGSSVSVNQTTGVGNFLGLSSDVITANGGNVVEIESGQLRMGDDTDIANGECGGASDAGTLRWNTAGNVDVCDGTSFLNVSSLGAEPWRIIDGDHSSDTYVTVAGTANTDTNTIVFHTNGVDRVTVSSSGVVDIAGDTDIGATLDVAGNVTLGDALTDTVNVAGDLSVDQDIDVDRDATVANDLIVDTDTLFVDASANAVGINDATPTASLDVTGTANITSNLNVDTDTLFVNATNDRVGINEPSPDEALHIVGDILAESAAGMSLRVRRTDGFVIQNENAGGGWARGLLANNGATRQAGAGFLGSPGTTESYHVGFGANWWTAGPAKLTILSNGNIGIGERSPDTLLDVDGAIEIGAGTCSAAGHAGRLQYTSGNNIEYCNGSSWQALSGEVDRIRDIGNVDIASDPTDGYVLQWDNTAKDWLAVNPTGLTVGGSGSADETGQVIDDDDDTWIRVEADNGSDNDTIRFAAGGVATGTERMRIESTGHVGIGVADPNYHLEVGGKVKTSTSVIFNPVAGNAPITPSGVGSSTLGDLSCSNGEVAKWNGSAWVCAADDAGSADTLAGLSCSTNQIAKYNGSAWVCAADDAGSSDVYEISCSEDSGDLYCTRMNKSTGATVTKRYDGFSPWQTRPTPFTASTAGSYSISCGSDSGSLYCTRMNKVTGATLTKQYDGFSPWQTRPTPF